MRGLRVNSIFRSTSTAGSVLAASLVLAACGEDVKTDTSTGNATTPTGTPTGNTTANPGGTPTASTTAGPSGNTTATPTTTAGTNTGSTDTTGATGGTQGTTSSSTTTTTTTTGTGTGTNQGCQPDEVYCAPGVCCNSTQDCVNNSCLAACPSKIRCGAALTECCDAGQVCHGPSCVAPGAGCTDDVDCPAGQYCEATQGKCFPQLESVNCEIRPQFSDVSLDYSDWSWTGGDVISIPVVADLDGDGFNEVVVNTTNEKQDPNLPGSIEHGDIVILSGVDGSVQVRLTEKPQAAKPEFGSSGRSTVAVADVDGDGAPDVIYAGRKVANSLTEKDSSGNLVYTGHDSSIYAYSYKKGEYLWVSHTGGPDKAGANYKEEKFVVHNGAITVANLDDDPQAEIVIGAVIIDNDGEVVWNQGGKGEYFGSDKNYVGAIAAVAELFEGTTQNRPEIITGQHAWKITGWQQGAGTAPAAVTVEPLWDANVENSGVTIADGYPAVADLDLDKDPEVVLVAEGRLYILEGATGKLWCGRGTCDNDAARTQPFQLAGSTNAPNGQVNYGGPPTIADFDGDGRPEVGVADYATYAMYDFKRNIGGVPETIPKSGTTPDAASIPEGGIFTRWSAATQDRSSSATGASVFDFQGDGAAEVVYADECTLHVYDGKTGSSLGQLPGSSATIHEYPVVVDVDNDKQTEVMVVANKIDNGTGQACPVTRSGIFVYGDRRERWVPTRPVWTQHTYHVTNADANGNPPVTEINNWDRSELNNYRQNTQGYGVFDAPDLRVKLSANLDECAQGRITLVATVRNAGARGVPSGVEVNFFRGKNSSGVKVFFARTTTALLPGASEQILFRVPAAKGQLLPDHYVHVDGIGQTNGAIAECLEDNNSDVLSGAGCPAE